MKLAYTLLTLSIAGLTMTSCVVPGYPDRQVHSSVGVSYGIFDTIPETYVGDTYFYGGRYYYGGRYETGRYSDQGHRYTNRYSHNGKYYYGGRQEHHESRGQSQRGGNTRDRGERERH